MTRLVPLLARVNEIDLEVDGIKTRLHEIIELLREPAALIAARQAAEKASAELAECRAVQRQCEQRQIDATARVKAAEEKLYSGAIKNPREVEDAQKDHAQLLHQQQTADEKLLEALVCIETCTATYTSAQATLKQLTAETVAQQTALRAEFATLKERLGVEQARQRTARAALTPKLLATYDTLRIRKGGRAVARLEGDSCGECRVAVPPSKLAEVLDSEGLVYCGNCGRLLWSE